MEFDDPGLLEWLESATPDAIDDLPFGVIRLDPEGRVLAYSRWESNFSGLPASSVLGRNFFTDVAPCSNNYLVAHVFTEPGAIDQALDYTFTYKLKPTQVRLRLLRREGAGAQFVLVRLR